MRRGSLIGIGLFAITRLDIVPTVFYAAAGFPILPEMEWWNEQVTSWFGSLLWVPHHVASLVACLIGFLLIWDAASTTSRSRCVAGGVFAGAAFASAAGTSIYVTLVFAASLIVWTAVTALRGWRKHTLVLLSAGAVAALLAVPYLRSLLSGPGTGGSFVTFGIRPFHPLDAVTTALQIGSATTPILRLLALWQRIAIAVRNPAATMRIARPHIAASERFSTERRG